ncbi:TetR/AcrR family transcriptional regulator [Streptomyces achromogenes]|uniref:TetR/AcrR family transcriptional regulator n=1 Tax=Streptomyces achromogenes TaxID=67255 RepID=UPI000568A69A|nr:TetR family transcriptional regulator [Streptomyces achromogenes]
MPRDSNATKARLLDAAFAEFAAHGIAGARVDRIASAAGANKRLIYAHFGSKDQLFDEVLRRAAEAGAESVPFDADDLPGYAGAVFDHLVARPDLLRLRLWQLLERPAGPGSGTEGFWRRAAEVADAQARGELSRALAPADLLTMVVAAAQAWFWVDDDGRPRSPERLARHRAAVVETARRLTEPRPPER